MPRSIKIIKIDLRNMCAIEIFRIICLLLCHTVQRIKSPITIIITQSIFIVNYQAFNTIYYIQKLSHSYIPVMFSTIKTPISFASEQLKTSTYGKRTNHF